MQTYSKEEQIDLLLEALNICYFAEIEANLLILKAEITRDVNIKIEYYKKALVPLSTLQDRSLILNYQCKIYQILSDLYKDIDDEVSTIYKNKIDTLCKNHKKERNYLFPILLFFVLFGWGVWRVLKK